MAKTKQDIKTGRLLVIGGAEDPDEGNMTILPHLVNMAGGEAARIFVCSSPSEKPKEKSRVYRKLFEKIGVAEVYEAPILGEGAVMVFDGRVSHTNAPQRGYSETLAVTDSMVHVLADGYGFNLETKRPILPDGAEIPAEHIGVA